MHSTLYDRTVYPEPVGPPNDSDGLRLQRALHPLCAGAWSGGWRRIAKSHTAVKGFALALTVCLAGSPQGWNSNDADFAALGRVHGHLGSAERSDPSRVQDGGSRVRASLQALSRCAPMILTSTGQTIPALRSRNCLAPSRQLKSINSGRSFRTLVQLRRTFVTYSRRDRAWCLGIKPGRTGHLSIGRRARHHSLWDWRVGCLRSDWTLRLRARRDVAALVVPPSTQ